MVSLLQRHKKALIFLLATWGLYFGFLFSRMIRLSPNGLVVGNENVWSDWPLHIAIANIVALKSPHLWFAYHPLYAGGKLTYPFLANVISGLLMRAGLSLPFAFIVPSLLTALFLLLGMYALWYVLLGSRKQAIGAISLFLLSSGWGFIHFIQDMINHPTWQTVWVPRVYSRIDDHQWYTGNVINGMLLPQRAFLLGMTFAVWAIVCLLVCLRSQKISIQQRWWLVGAGLLVGLLPITHMHSFIVMAVVSLCLFGVTWRRWHIWLPYGMPAATLGLILYALFIRGGIETPHFMTFSPGWTATSVADWFHQWWWQWGLAPVVALLGFWQWRRKGKVYEKAFFAAFLILFIAANTILFQPTQWDNSKLFLWVYFALSGLMATGLAYLWRRPWFAVRVVTILVTICLIGSGALEVLRLQTLSTTPLLVSSTEEVLLADQIRHETAPTAVFLTAPIHNSLISMWAVRPILLGYIGWISNYGFLYEQREKDMYAIYAGYANTAELVARYDISYVVIGPQERRLAGLNESYFATHYPAAFSSNNYVIYDVRNK